MAKCYYCGGAGCSQCRKMTTSSYGADALPQDPSPNGKNPCAEVSEIDTIKAGLIAHATDRIKEIYGKAQAAQQKKQKETLYGWVSKRAFQFHRGSIYSRPDGSEVLVSFVNRDPINHDTGWKDCKCIGEVVDWIRKG